jgi:hypothetical protein
MKTSITLGLALVAVMAGSLFPSSNVMARAVYNGAICHNYDKGQANDLDYYGDGVKNVATAPRRVICPLAVEHTPGETVGGIWVDVNTSIPIKCTAYSFAYDDIFLGAKTNTSTIGITSVFLDTVIEDDFSSHSVVCTLPANGKGKIVAIHPSL